MLVVSVSALFVVWLVSCGVYAGVLMVLGLYSCWVYREFPWKVFDFS